MDPRLRWARGVKVSMEEVSESRCCRMPFCGVASLLLLSLPLMLNCTEGRGESSVVCWLWLIWWW